MSALRSIAAYAEALASLMPRGRAWPEAGGAVWRQLMNALAPEHRRADARLLRLLEEADPRTCGETLEDWERVLGLPDPCTPGDATFVERRDAVVAKLRAIGGASAAYFIALAADLGYEIEIQTYTPFTCGLSHCGADHQTGSPTMRFYWSVKPKNARVRWFRAGDPASQAGLSPHATIGLAHELECLFNRLKPAETVVVFDYSDALQGG